MSLQAIILQSLVTALLTLGAGVALYETMGVSAISAVLFAFACGVISVAISHIFRYPGS